MYKFLFLLGIVVCCVAGCGGPKYHTNLDWMLHPEEMMEAYQACIIKLSNQISPTCVNVMRAQERFANFVAERAHDPEKFGQKILAAQMKMMSSYRLYQQNLREYQAMKDRGALAKNKQLSLELLEVTNSLNQYHLNAELVNVLLVVIATTSKF